MADLESEWDISDIESNQTFEGLKASYILSLDQADEEEYSQRFMTNNLTRLRIFTIISPFAIILFELIISKSFTKEYIAQIVILNLILLSDLLLNFGFMHFMSRETQARWMNLKASATMIILGPLMIVTYFYMTQVDFFLDFQAIIYYLTMMFSTIYFLQPRFISVILVLIFSCVPLWQWVNVRIVSSGKETFIPYSIFLLVSYIVMALLAYDQEYISKYRFLMDKKFKNDFKRLKTQVLVLTADTLDSPIESALHYIGAILATPDVEIEHLRALRYIYECLNASDLIRSSPLINNDMSMNEEQKKWLMNEVSAFRAANSSSPVPAIITNSVGGRNSILSNTKNMSIDGLRTKEICSMLQKIPNYNFPIFDFQNISSGKPLTILSHRLIVESGLLSRLGLPVEKFLNFVISIENSYDSSLPFHNSLHATDVLHCIYYLTSNLSKPNAFSDVELLAIYISAIVHDVAHPGVSNNFLIAVRSPMSILYNDKSILENHHCSKAFTTLEKPECNFLQSLEGSQYKIFRNLVVEMVLATDLSHHFSILGTFKKRLLTPEEWSPAENSVDKLLLLQILIKCSDVSNPTKSWPLYSEWINRITQEFYNQGDKEKQFGLPVSPFCDRDHDSTESCQKSFISFIVSPLFESVASWIPIQAIIQGLSESKSRFCNDELRNSSVRGRLSRKNSQVLGIVSK